jgi:hypothetical protein
VVGFSLLLPIQYPTYRARRINRATQPATKEKEQTFRDPGNEREREGRRKKGHHTQADYPHLFVTFGCVPVFVYHKFSCCFVFSFALHPDIYTSPTLTTSLGF